MHFLGIAELSAEELTNIKATLPDSVHNMCRVIGLEAALNIAREFGGTDLRFPPYGFGNGVDFRQRLEACIGAVKADALLKEYAGDEMYIPSCQKTRQLLRNMKIVREYDAMILQTSVNNAVSQLARRYDLSNRSIDKIVNTPIGE